MTREELEDIIQDTACLDDERFVSKCDILTNLKEMVEHMKVQEYNIQGAGGLVDYMEGSLEKLPSHDTVTKPKHYVTHPSGIECIQITEHMNFNLGNVIKYIWRHDSKNGLEDLKKAQWYLNREIERLEK